MDCFKGQREVTEHSLKDKIEAGICKRVLIICKEKYQSLFARTFVIPPHFAVLIRKLGTLIDKFSDLKNFIIGDETETKI